MPKMDNCGLSLLEGVRHNHCKEDRDGQHLKARLLRQLSVGGRPKSKAAAQKERQGRSRRSSSKDGKRGGLTSPGISAGCMSELNVGLESNPLQLSMTLSRWMACLPRWILKTRTKLACCRRRSFAIMRRSSETSSKVFPLPLAPLGFLGLFCLEQPWLVTSPMDFSLSDAGCKHLDFGFGLFVFVPLANL